MEEGDDLSYQPNTGQLSKDPSHNELRKESLSVSIDLTNQKHEVGVDLAALKNDKLFSKTAPDEFLAMSK